MNGPSKERVGIIGVGLEVDQDCVTKRHFSSFVVSRSRYLIRRRAVSGLDDRVLGTGRDIVGNS